ncbi:hypothetical protein GCK72_021498 [Caenorhabditis remanei]|uniref:Sdz-33 F-box domain-containing protein n=1 Tax=Caenorhabditis remanei TaxID=31234 RepID=A0A6A5GJT1_CAERE|nr:hypothetical protein GCK72_021498 [Caenorhabditis remanei]KAF1754933.1 hypothetical protein GCK72_021498 [Caenorhabditis remanei]
MNAKCSNLGFALCFIHNFKNRFNSLQVRLELKLALSTLSARTKTLVKSLKIQIRKTYIHIREEVSFSIWKLDFNQEDWYFSTNVNDAYITNDMLDEPCYLETRTWVDDQIPIFLWKKEGFTVNNWVQHFLEVLGRKEIDKLFFQCNPENLNLEILHKAIGDVNQLHIQHQLSAESCLQIVQYLQSAKVLSMFLGLSENFQKILLQNFEIVILTARQPAIIDLDTLLVINSCSIQLQGLNITNKTVNRFLKHCIAGSNPNMRHLGVLLPANEVFSETEVFRGVDCSFAPEDRELEFKDHMETVEKSKTTMVTGGIDIRKKESGTTATIKCEDGQFQMNVWDD